MSIGSLSGFMQLSNFEALATGLDSVVQGVSGAVAQAGALPLDQIIQSFAPPGLVPPSGSSSVAGAADFPSPANFLGAVGGASPHLGAVRDVLADPTFNPVAGLAQSLGGVFDGGLLNRLIGTDGLLNPLLGGLSLVTPGTGDLSGQDAVGRRTVPDGLEEVGRRTMPDGLEEVGRRTMPGGLDEVGRRTMPGGLDEVGRRTVPGGLGDLADPGIYAGIAPSPFLEGLTDTLRDVAGIQDPQSAKGLETLGRLREQLGALDRMETGVRELVSLQQSLDSTRLEGGKIG